MSIRSLHDVRSRAGKSGHRAVIYKYGPEFFRINGARGGRPRTKDYLDVLFERPAARPQTNLPKRRQTADTPESIPHYNSLLWLKKMWRERQARRGRDLSPRPRP